MFEREDYVSKADVNRALSGLNCVLSGFDFGFQTGDAYVENVCGNYVKTQHIDCEYLSRSENDDGTVTIRYRPKVMPEVISVDFTTTNNELKTMLGI